MFVIYTTAFLRSYSQNKTSTPRPISKDSQQKVRETKLLHPENKTEKKINSTSQKCASLKNTGFWKSVLIGIPYPKSTLISLAIFSVNLTLLFGVLDYVHRARTFYPAENLSFARIGYISPTEASIVLREPNTSLLPISVFFRIETPKETSHNLSWQTAGTITSLDNSTDFTGALNFKIPNGSDRTYKWTTSNNHSGFFTTPPNVGNMSENGDFTFLTSSCIKIGFPYNPFNHPLTISGFKYISKVLKIIPRAQFMLFLGDFIYIDVPRRFGTSVEDYRREYRQVYASPDWSLVGQNLSWLHVLDDHEIANDWDSQKSGVYNSAVDPWRHYQTVVNPPRPRRADNYDKVTYFQFTQGPASFFMLDTRTYRESSRGSPPNATEKTMLGESQLSDLLAFLQKDEVEGVQWKFVISSVPFTKNWRVNALDTWAGYLSERQKVLEAMWDAGLCGGVSVVVLSGDRHEFAATAFPPPIGGKWPSSATVNELSVSPLNQFYLPVPSYKQLDDEDVEIK